MNNDEILVIIKDMFEKKFDEVKLDMETLIEDLRRDVKVIAEGQSILVRKIDDLKKDFFEAKQN